MENMNNNYDFLDLLAAAHELSEEGYVSVDAVHPYYFNKEFDYQQYLEFISNTEEEMIGDPIMNIFQQNFEFHEEEKNMAKIIFRNIIVKKSSDGEFELSNEQFEVLNNLGGCFNGFYEAYNEKSLEEVVKSDNEAHNRIMDKYYKILNNSVKTR